MTPIKDPKANRPRISLALASAALALTLYTALPANASPRDSGETRKEHGFEPRGERREKWSTGRSAGGPMQRMAQELGLSEEQQKQMKELQGEKSARQEERQKMKALREEMHSLIESDSASDDQIRQKSAEMLTEMTRHHEQRTEKILAMRKILKPEQRKKMREMMQSKMKQRFGDRGGRHEGPPFDGDGPEEE